MNSFYKMYLFSFIFIVSLAFPVNSQQIQLVRKKPDPYGCPRPYPGETNVPLNTSIYFQLGFKGKGQADKILKDSLIVKIHEENGLSKEVIGQECNFACGYSGNIFHDRNKKFNVYIEIKEKLKPLTNYTVSVSAKSKDGSILNGKNGQWKFTTEKSAISYPVNFSLDLSKNPVQWRGGFFTGYCKPSFCTSAMNFMSSYKLISKVRNNYPKAWSLVRDVSPTLYEAKSGFISWQSPNVVRELETRRILSLNRRDDGVLLKVEDFFGHQQYGIESNRAISLDYNKGDEVLIADGFNHVNTKVIKIINDSNGLKSLLVSSFEKPKGGWKTEYTKALPDKENANAPGLFPPGGCYLRKFKPSGTVRYYWKRLDKEWDISHKRYGLRLVVNFTDAPGDLSIDGKNWTYPKDYAQYHQVIHTYTTHLIERYGDACMDFYWSVFNEPDLARAFWRNGNWAELQKFYDYTIDAILRAFEDKGYDSEKVMVGGLEIGGIFGIHLRGPILETFLIHCSPKASSKDVLPHNMTFIDKRLDGKRSQRVEKLCKKNNGKGTPFDFISVHAYNSSKIMADKLIEAKKIALEIDPEFYSNLLVNSFESCPSWKPPPDIAADDSYLGNGYFPSWCSDVIRRQLRKANEDPRYSFGETILTFWPWPNQNFKSVNNATRIIDVDKDGDGKKDYSETVAMPILHFLALISSTGEQYWPLPGQVFDGHVVSGFASKNTDAICLLLYSHNSRDIQSRSEKSFFTTVNLKNVPWENVQIKKYQFDKDNNSYFHFGRKLRDMLDKSPYISEKQVDEIIVQLKSEDPNDQISAIKQVALLKNIPENIAILGIELYNKTNNQQVRMAIEKAASQINSSPAYSIEQVEQIKEMSNLKVTKESTSTVEKDGSLRLSAKIPANGAVFLIISQF